MTDRKTQSGGKSQPSTPPKTIPVKPQNDGYSSGNSSGKKSDVTTSHFPKKK